MTDVPQNDAPTHEDPEEAPTDEELEEPSTEKEPDEVPTAPADEPEPSHEAVGIGIIGRPQTEQGDGQPQS